VNHHPSRLLAALACALLALCISATAAASGATLTKAQYVAMLKRANVRVTKVEGAAERGLTPKATRAQVKALMLAWASVETQLGKSFRSVHPPAKVAAANSLLARGEITFGGELRSAANHLPLKKTAIGAFLQRRLSSAKGAALVDKALKKLKAAGYSAEG
jgi:hypothetical protein